MGLGVILGAVAGATWGGLHYGIVGGVLGVPLGAVLGFLGMFVSFVALALVVVIGFGVWAVCRRGPRGLGLLYWYGPEGVASGGPPRPAEPNQPNEAGG